MKFVEIRKSTVVTTNEEDQKIMEVRDMITQLSVATKDFIMNSTTGECVEKSDLDKAFEILDILYCALHYGGLETN
jgi:hypothetical protein